MGNILDYIKWRGDIPFSVDPFNEVDNLIFSELAYVNFPNASAITFPISVIDSNPELFKTGEENAPGEDNESPSQKRMALLREVANNNRYKNTTFTSYINETSPDQESQFAAVTFLLEDGSAYVAFRGTDSSFVGWKESLELSYLPEIEGQRKAVEYLNRLSISDNIPLRVGGHSKGGNLAVYASAFCDVSLRDRIIEVYSNDGPGFSDEIIQSEEYQKILPKIIHIIPDASVIGRLMLCESIPRIVRSTALGLGQHNGFTWCVERNHFEKAEVSGMGVFLDKSVSDWSDQIDSETRHSLVLSIFTLLEGTGKSSFHELKGQKRKALESILVGINALPEEKRQELFYHIRLLLQSGRQTVRTEVAQYLENVLQEQKILPEPEQQQKINEALRMIRNERKNMLDSRNKND